MSADAGEQQFASTESAIRRLWSSHGLPSPSGTLGRGSGPVLRQLVGTYTPGDPPVMVAQRAVAADVDARASVLAGGRAFATLRREGWRGETADHVVDPLLEALAVWAGGAGGKPYDAEARTAGVQRIADHLARLEVLVVRDGPVRLCPTCKAPRSPERTNYHEEVGDTFLIRFPLEAQGDLPSVDALAWVDAPWRLLGMSALLVSPDLPYVTVEYRRGDVVARLLVLRSSLGRLKSWLSGIEFTVVDERPGRAFAGRRYTYPLRHEFPDGASLLSPSGTVQAVPEVGDSGTGVVPLVPGHGGTDAQIAARLGLQGWPLLTVDGKLDLTLMHKYSGLDLETASEFVARDLTEAGSVLARLRVLRGVPYCGVCGHPLVWFPARCWCLDPGRLPPEQLARYSRILPHDRPVPEIEITPWAVSETVTTDAPEAVRLLECDRCSRLNAPDGGAKCRCGGKRRVVGRRLVPSVAGAFAAWARNDPVPPGDPVRLYVGERRRAPAVVHQLAAMAAVEAPGAEVSATVLPTITDVDLIGLVRDCGADAVRAAFVRTGTSEGPGGSFVERCHQERHRLARLAELADATALALERAKAPVASLAALSGDRELEPEDRALVARWSATEVRVLSAYEELRPAEAHRRLVRFLEIDLARYRELVRSREASGDETPSARAAARTLASVVVAIATALAPIAPFTAESVVRRLRPEPRSLFESEPFDVDRSPPDEDLAEAWDRWLAVVRAADRFRADRRLAPHTTLPTAAVVVSDDQLGDRLRGDRSLIERLAGIGRLEVGSPRSPWEGRRRQLVPVESQIQRAYPSSSAQIVHLLRRMPSRKPGDLANPQGFTVFVQGQPHQITPEMLSVVETLPERVVPTPFALGEMYVEAPAGSGAGGPEALLALSADASWLVRRVARRLRAVGADAARPLSVRVLAVDPLAQELRERWAAIAAALGVSTLTIDAPSGVETDPPTLTGRTRLGARWSVEIPGVERRPEGMRAPTARAPPGSTRRMPVRRSGPLLGGSEVDYADEQVIHHEEEVRALGEQLDKLLDAPLLGPAKVALAWGAGYSSVDEFAAASFEELSTLPGFGRPVASRFFSKLGRPVPPPPPWARPAVAPGAPPAPPAPLRERPAALSETAPEAPEQAPDRGAPPAEASLPTTAPAASSPPSLPLPTHGPPEPSSTATEGSTPLEPPPTEVTEAAESAPPPAETAESSAPPAIEPQVPPAPPPVGPPEPAPAPEMRAVAPSEPLAADRTGPAVSPIPATALTEANPAEPPTPEPPESTAPPAIEPQTLPAPLPAGPTTASETRATALTEPLAADTTEPAVAASPAAAPPETSAVEPTAPELPEPTSPAAEPTSPSVAPVRTVPVAPSPVPTPAPSWAPAASSPPPTALPPLDVAPVPGSAGPPSETPPAGAPRSGGLEVEVSEVLLPALQPFLDATAAGHRGLAVVREGPERIRTLVGPRPVAVYWLSNLTREQTIRPADLTGLGALFRKEIESNAITAIFLEGVEYLTRIHGTTSVIGVLKELDRLAREHDARAWLHLTPGLLSAADLEQIVRDFGPPAPSTVDLSTK
jgi:hypothetical protein